jgi:hypothetical protein
MVGLCLASARGFIITPHGGRHDATSRNIALFTVLVSTDDHYLVGVTNQITDAAVAICTARHYGSTMPFLLDFANLRDDHVAMLAGLGWIMHNVTDSIGMWQGKYKPVYNKTQAIQENRPWEDDQPVQDRKDGWATYFKFKAWTHDEYDTILVSDADIVWKGNPDPILEGPGFDVSFQAFEENADRKRTGLNTRLMIITPSKDLYNILVDRASSGNYVPYTNTEQDVLESQFPAEDRYVPKDQDWQLNTGKVMELFKHRHRHCKCDGLNAERLARVQTCQDIWRACKERNLDMIKDHKPGKPIWKQGEIVEPLW